MYCFLRNWFSAWSFAPANPLPGKWQQRRSSAWAMAFLYIVVAAICPHQRPNIGEILADPSLSTAHSNYLPLSQMIEAATNNVWPWHGITPGHDKPFVETLSANRGTVPSPWHMCTSSHYRVTETLVQTNISSPVTVTVSHPFLFLIGLAWPRSI